MTILDFTSRLPGPLSTCQLQDLGAKIIKIENDLHPDPFSKDQGIFLDWYNNLNNQKKVLKLDYSAPNTKTIIRDLLEKSQGAIIALPNKIKKTLGLEVNDLKNLKGTKCFISIYASKDKKEPLHDLGALARCGALKLHIDSLKKKKKSVLPPPFLPMAGINFSNQIATNFLAWTIYASKEQKVLHFDLYLECTTVNFFKKLLPNKPEKAQKIKNVFAHNGAYPCYNIYILKDDHFVAVSLLEEQYWKLFLEKSKLSDCLQLADQYNDNNQYVFEKLENFFKQYSALELKDFVQQSSLFCLDII